MSAPVQTEKAFQAQVVTWARLNGWLCFHPYDSRRSVPGYPDVTAIHPAHGCIWIELKVGRGKLSSEQEQWRDALIAAGQEWHLFTPDDWSTIEKVLAREVAT